jgi:cephalosporin hydroxylase
MWDEVRRAWSESGNESRTYWKGRQILKNPCDLWAIQEVIYETQVEVLVEAGTRYGGSAYFYGDLGVEVHSIDLAPPKTPYPHPNVTYYTGYSTSPANLVFIGLAIEGKRTMVVLDSDHHKKNVLKELDAFAPMVSEGCYLVCEDTYLGNLDPEFVGDSPKEALEEWLPNHPEFQVDRSRDKWNVSMHPEGWLLRCG